MKAERLIGSIRREYLDHVVVIGESHLRRMLAAYAFVRVTSSSPFLNERQRGVARILPEPSVSYYFKARRRSVAHGDLLFAAAHTAAHGFEKFSADFAVRVVFYGPQK